MTEQEVSAREQRGLQIAALCPIIKKGGIWLVPSQSGAGKYTVYPDAENPHCTCPDHETRGCKCKHIFAVEFAMKREQHADGSVTETATLTLTEKRTTYSQDWRAYNRAQTSEKATFQVLLHQLCQGIQEPPQTMGRPKTPIRDAIFAAVFKVYSTVSGRRSARLDVLLHRFRQCSRANQQRDVPTNLRRFRWRIRHGRNVGREAGHVDAWNHRLDSGEQRDAVCRLLHGSPVCPRNHRWKP